MSLKIQIEVSDDGKMQFASDKPLPPAQMIALLLEISKSMVMAIPTNEDEAKPSEVLIPTARDIRAVRPLPSPLNGRIHARSR